MILNNCRIASDVLMRRSVIVCFLCMEHEPWVAAVKHPFWVCSLWVQTWHSHSSVWIEEVSEEFQNCFNMECFPPSPPSHAKLFVTIWKYLALSRQPSRLFAGGFYWEVTEGSLANVQKPTLTCWSPAWDLVFSRILLTCLSACRANQQTPNEPTLKKQTLSQPTSFSYVLWGWRDKTSQGLMMLQRPQ